MNGAIKINQQNSSVQLCINTLFYDRNAILSCVRQFMTFYDVSYSDKADAYFELTLIPKDKEHLPDNIGYEFFNALLAEIKNKEKV